MGWGSQVGIGVLFNVLGMGVCLGGPGMYIPAHGHL